MSNKLDERFGMALKTLRESRGKSQEDFVKIGRSYLSELERGLKTPTLETIVILAEELGVTPTYLVALATGPEQPELPVTTSTSPIQLADLLTRAYHLAANAEREVAGTAIFSPNNSIGEVNQITLSGKVELGRLLADAALLAFSDNRENQSRTRRANLEFITANKRTPAELKYAEDSAKPDDWWLRPDEALDALKAANRTIELIDFYERTARRTYGAVRSDRHG